MFDVLVATVGLAASAPVTMLAIVAVKLTSPGPAFFRQVRVGLDRRPFTLLKLRTMRQGNDDSSHRELCLRELVDPDAEAGTSDGIFKLEDDPRVTPVGRLLRRFSIDELPQLLNVLVGDMAIVGPRPMLPWEFDVVADTYGARVLVKPGITGLWQVSGRNRVNMRRMLELDVQYVRQRSWRLDLSIMTRTVRVLLQGDGAR